MHSDTALPPNVVNAVHEKTREVLSSAKKLQDLDHQENVPELVDDSAAGDTPGSNNSSLDSSSHLGKTSTEGPLNPYVFREAADDSKAIAWTQAIPATEHMVDDDSLSGLSTQHMPLTSSFFSKEFWTGDYVNYASILPGEIIPPSLGFSNRLARHGLATGYHNLRGDIGYSAEVARLQYRYGLSVRSIGFILANTREVLVRLVNAEMQTAAPLPPPPMAEHFMHQDAQWGYEISSLMSVLGDSTKNYFDCEQVEDYLYQKGLYHDDGKVLRMALDVPQSAAHGIAVQKQHVELNSADLISKLVNVAICLGYGVGFPKATLNRILVSSVTKMVQ